MARYHLHKHDQCNCVLDAFSFFEDANYNRFEVLIQNRKCNKLTLLGITEYFELRWKCYRSIVMKSYRYNFGIDSNKYSKLFAI